MGVNHNGPFDGTTVADPPGSVEQILSSTPAEPMLLWSNGPWLTLMPALGQTF